MVKPSNTEVAHLIAAVLIVRRSGDVRQIEMADAALGQMMACHHDADGKQGIQEGDALNLILRGLKQSDHETAYRGLQGLLEEKSRILREKPTEGFTGEMSAVVNLLDRFIEAAEEALADSSKMTLQEALGVIQSAHSTYCLQG